MFSEPKLTSFNIGENNMNCKYCCSVYSRWIRLYSGPHAYRVDCADCGRFIKWGNDAQMRKDLQKYPRSFVSDKLDTVDDQAFREFWQS